MAYTWKCARCGERHEGLPLSWAFAAPDYWAELDDSERAERGFCNADYCFMTDDGGDPAWFVRGTTEIPIVDPADPDEASVVLGVWASLSETSFDEVLRVQEEDDGTGAGPWFGGLSNQIPVYPDNLGLPMNVRYRPGLRPIMELHRGDHPLARDAAGITMTRALELAELLVHAEV